MKKRFQIVSSDGKSSNTATLNVVFHHALPKQRNSHDCGLFVIMYFFYITRQAHLDFSTCDMPLIRQWLAALLVARSYEGMRPYLGWLLPKIAENKYKIGSLHLRDVPCPSELIPPSTPQPHIPSDPMEPPCFKTNKKVHLPSIQAPVTSNVMEPCSKKCPGPPSSPPAHVHHVPLSEASECITYNTRGIIIMRKT